MKHVRESLRNFRTYQFFKLFEEETEKKSLKDKEKDGLAVIDKITKNFEDFKKDADDNILQYKEFWEENKSKKNLFKTEKGDIYKMYDDDYVVGVLELPVETLSDGSVSGGLGATDEPEEEIIEGKEITQDVPDPTDPQAMTEAFSENPEQLPTENPEELPAEEPPLETPTETPSETPEELPAEEPSLETPEEPTTDLTAPQKYLVVYDLSGGEREEIFRCGSNNVVKAFYTFYNDVFKGSMKDIINRYKEQKEVEKVDAEKSEKQKAEKEKDSKVKKFLGKTNESVNENIFTSEYDNAVNKIYQQIVNNFDINNLTEEDDYLVYKLNDTVVKVRNDEFFAIPGYTLEIDGDDIQCSHILNKKMYNFLNKKWNEKESSRKKKHIVDFINKFNESLNEDIDLGASNMGDDYDTWLEEVKEYLLEQYDLSESDVELFLEIAEEQLTSLHESGANPLDAAGTLVDDEEIWDELKNRIADDPEYDHSEEPIEDDELPEDELNNSTIPDDTEDKFEVLRDDDTDLVDDEELLGGEEDLLDDEETGEDLETEDELDDDFPEGEEESLADQNSQLADDEEDNIQNMNNPKLPLRSFRNREE